MTKYKIPDEFVLKDVPRYKRQNMERAMRGRIERGLVELITNSDDSYRDLEEKGLKVSGKIRIEIERRKKGTSKVIVRDRACGMNRREMFDKLGTLGRRTSGHEKGKARRGLHGRGARDVVAFGTIHFESIKDGEYNHLIILPSLKCRFEKPCSKYFKKANKKARKKLGILRGNGTVVTIEVDDQFKIPLHETLTKDFSRYYSLRDIFSNPDREVPIVDLNKKREDRLIYKNPEGIIVYNEDFTIPDFPDAKVHLTINKHETSFEKEGLPYREGGILIKGGAAIHDCTYFGLESEPYSYRFTGKLSCDYIDDLIREYDDRYEKNPDNPNHPENNPIRLLDPFRDGLILEHPFAQALYKKCKEILRPIVDELKDTEEYPKRDVTNENLKKKLDKLSKEISKVFEEKLIEQTEEPPPPGDIKNGEIEELLIGLHIIPPEEQQIIVDKTKTFSIIVKHYEALDESLPVNISNSNPEDIEVNKSTVFLKKSLEDEKVGKTTFSIRSSKVGSEALIEARYDGHENLLLVKVVEPPPLPIIDLPNGLSFEKTRYHLRINKEKTLILRLKTDSKLSNDIITKIKSDHPEVVVKGGGRCKLRKTRTSGELIGKIRVCGRQLKVKGEITALLEGYEPAKTVVIVEERLPVSGIKLKFRPDEDDFGPVRYKWDIDDPYLLLIGAKHPTIRRYLGEPSEDEKKYPGIDSPLYHSVLAEVISEALSFRILKKQFKKEGQGGMLDFDSTDAYYHKHFSEFLKIAHKILVKESI